MKLVSIEFKKKGKQYLFLDNNIELNINDYVIVETERGLQFGKVSRVIDNNDNKDHSIVVRIATKSDVEQNNKNIEDAQLAVEKAQDMANDLSLDMKFIDAFFTFDQKQLVFHFIADARVDFRELARNLASVYKTRIELRQVGVRDKAKEVSGIGQCGRKLCCSSFLNDLDSVSINMVKNQNLALNPSKINGLCGRLLCCLKYEDEIYLDNRKKLPDYGSFVKDKSGFEGNVTFVDVPNMRYIITNSNGEKKEVKLFEKCDKCEKRRSNK